MIETVVRDAERVLPPFRTADHGVAFRVPENERVGPVGDVYRVAVPSIEAHLPHGVERGRALGVTEEGLLRLRLPSGRIRLLSDALVDQIAAGLLAVVTAVPFLLEIAEGAGEGPFLASLQISYQAEGEQYEETMPVMLSLGGLSGVEL